MRSSTDRVRRVLAAVSLALSTAVVVHGGTALPVSQEGAVFSSRVNTVRVDVSVRQDGRAVTGLTASDFEVSDDGVRQQIDLVSTDRTPVDVVVALDVSGSVQGTRLTQLRAAAGRLFGLLEPADSSALITFTERVVTSGGLTTDRTSARSTLERTLPGRDTALIDATHAAMVLGQAAHGRPLVIVFSDGVDTASFLSPAQVLDTARRTGAVVYAVTTPLAEPGGVLEQVVHTTGGRRLDVSSLDRVADAFAEVLRESRERYLISYTPTGVRPGGWHRLSVRVRGRRADVHARPGYLAG